eukprot:344381-Hanusia_phi.AAC.1
MRKSKWRRRRGRRGRRKKREEKEEEEEEEEEEEKEEKSSSCLHEKNGGDQHVGGEKEGRGEADTGIIIQQRPRHAARPRVSCDALEHGEEGGGEGPEESLVPLPEELHCHDRVHARHEPEHQERVHHWEQRLRQPLHDQAQRLDLVEEAEEAEGAEGAELVEDGEPATNGDQAAHDDDEVKDPPRALEVPPHAMRRELDPELSREEEGDEGVEEEEERAHGGALGRSQLHLHSRQQETEDGVHHREEPLLRAHLVRLVLVLLPCSDRHGAPDVLEPDAAGVRLGAAKQVDPPGVVPHLCRLDLEAIGLLGVSEDVEGVGGALLLEEGVLPDLAERGGDKRERACLLRSLLGLDHLLDLRHVVALVHAHDLAEGNPVDAGVLPLHAHRKDILRQYARHVPPAYRAAVARVLLQVPGVDLLGRVRHLYEQASCKGHVRLTRTTSARQQRNDHHQLRLGYLVLNYFTN